MAISNDKQLAFHFDQTRCMGCQTCVVACKDWNELAPGTAKLRNMYDQENGTFPNVSVFMTLFSCNHCAEPACIKACPYSAIYKRETDGIVVLDRNLCQGYGECKNACPYDAPQLPDDDQETPSLSADTNTKGHKMIKCNMCLDRIEDGQKPVCVGACLTRAIDVDTISNIEAKYPNAKTIKTGTLTQFPDDLPSGGTEADRTTPSFYFTPRT